MTVPDVAVPLFELDPPAFVAARDDLVRSLKAAGDPGAAAAVKALRRPTVAAAALNHVSRDQPDLITAVAGAAQELARVQRRALSGVRGADLRGAVRAHHAAIDEVLSALDPDTTPVRDAVRTALLAAAVDTDLARAIATGVLQATPTTAPDPTAALGMGVPLAAVPDAADATASADGEAAAEDEARIAAERAARARVEEAERHLGQVTMTHLAAARRHRTTAEAAERARTAADAADADVARLREELTAAEETARTAAAQAAEADHRLVEAARVEAEAEAAVTAAAEALEAARDRLDGR
ncbi:hypothetical protein [Euzebya sp.]|uniref:hypothetical protein n=1 Tax=Euzebya sp. TaxID=1971409 RepID=UPI003517EBD3